MPHARDEEIVALIVQIILREGTVATQTLLAQLVNAKLERKDMHVTAQRVRVLAARSGLVALTIRASVRGASGELKECPVCHSKLKRTENQTLTGKSAATGYKCTRCPYWTGRELRIPNHYTFQARVTRAERGDDGQLAFVQRSTKGR